jgi:RNA polymerase sigma factor (sigma-70 family)
MDEKQFLSIVNQHQGIIHKICRLYRNGREDQEDLFQEIVFQLWRSIASYKGDAKITSWMYRIALNTAIAVYRKGKPDISFSDELPDYAEELNENEEIRKAQLFEALKKLDDAEKALIALYFEELSYKEIAEIIGISENYVAVKLNRIKTKIQKLLKN